MRIILRNLLLKLLCKVRGMDYLLSNKGRVIPIFYNDVHGVDNGVLLNYPLTNWHGNDNVGTAIFVDGKWYSYFLYATYVRLNDYPKPPPIEIN